MQRKQMHEMTIFTVSSFLCDRRECGKVEYDGDYLTSLIPYSSCIANVARPLPYIRSRATEVNFPTIYGESCNKAQDVVYMGVLLALQQTHTHTHTNAMNESYPRSVNCLGK